MGWLIVAAFTCVYGFGATSVLSWGGNTNGQLGDGTNLNRTAPVATGLTGANVISGGGSHSLILLKDGSVRASGFNVFGQLGDGSVTTQLSPVQVSGLSGVIAVAAGGFHSLALKSDGTVWAWGYNGFGELGDGTTIDRWMPVQVTGLSGVVAVAAGGYHSLALKSDGTVWAWGYNSFGSVGDGTIIDRVVPTQVSGLGPVAAIAAGDLHSLAVLSDGTVCAWGANFEGQLGDGTTVQRATPVTISGLAGAVAVAGGARHSLALLSNGTVQAWGSNTYGQLGDGTLTNRATPTPVPNLAGVLGLAAGGREDGAGSFSLVRLTDGTLRAWGSNQFGALGNGTFLDSATPTIVQGTSGVQAIAAGFLHALAIREDVVPGVGPIASNVLVNPSPVAINASSSLTATISDATTGGSNIGSASYSVNSGALSQMLLASSAAVTTQASATLAPFPSTGVYSICVQGTDALGNTGESNCVLLPVYDPNGRFVTGGGSVGSPTGADLINTSAAGLATFGFVSKYLPGKNVPSGNLEFQFTAGNLKFRSTSMDWLVVTGEPRARFRGTGVVNGTNVCSFEVDAWADSFDGGGDAFGIKITSCANGGDRYVLPATKLTTGNIVVH